MTVVGVVGTLEVEKTLEIVCAADGDVAVEARVGQVEGVDTAEDVGVLDAT